MRERSTARTLVGAVGAAAVGAFAGASARTVREALLAVGGRPSGARAERMRRSPQFRDGRFRNGDHTAMMASGMVDTLRDLVFGRERRTPTGPVPLVTPVATAPPGQGELFVTWYGHASTLVELDGARVLFDPVWNERASPASFAGPRRLHPVPVALERLPTLDAVVISHDHYDHLDMDSVRTLVRTQAAPFVVPLGVGAHLERWRVPADRIIELDWSESTELAGLRIVSTPAQHFSGRLFRRDGTLWTSWTVLGPNHRVFYTGDSGYFDGYAKIGDEYGPFDVSLVQVGAYGAAWPTIHMTPEEGVAAHVDLKAELLVPVHWATFNLALHGWTEPADRIWLEAKARDVRLAVPRPGERIDVDDPPAVDGWWQALG